MKKLSILIPARNEEFLDKTLDGLARKISPDTEILVGMDGGGKIAHPEFKHIITGEPIGQRAMQNRLAKTATGDYLMKLDGHVEMSEGFDVEMVRIAEENKDTMIVPLFMNLHAYDWVCKKCGARNYQGVMPNALCCEWGKDIVWTPKPSPAFATAYFDHKFAFQCGEPANDELLRETMSIQGQAWVVSKDLYWDLELCDESFGSWGQQGVEMACKMWLSGRRVLSTKNAWCAHLFRGIDDFPYQRDMTQVHNAQVKSKELFMGNKWPKQVRPFKWLIEHFDYPLMWKTQPLT